MVTEGISRADLDVRGQNRLLAALPADAMERLKVNLEPVSLALRQVMYDPGETLYHVHFPTNSIVSLLYTQSLLTQMSQTADCNRLHSVEQQLCRWLLLSHDRLKSNELVMTQELIANMLEVRREGVSVAAHRLQDAGLIHYRRGHIMIVDREGLEKAVCECYQVVKTECDRLLTYYPAYCAEVRECRESAPSRARSLKTPRPRPMPR
jgi:hypothetical protein